MTQQKTAPIKSQQPDRNSGEKKSSKKPFIFAGAGTLLVAAAVCALLFSTSTSNNSGSEINTPTTPPDPEITEMNAKYLFVGTTFWGRRTNQNARASELGVKYPFSQLDTLERNRYQAWIGGLECPVTDKGHNYSEEEKIFKFNCDPDYLPEAAKYFTAFLLGNNHAGNQGLEGLRTTRKYLDEYNIQYFGTPKRTGNDRNDPEYANDESDINNCSVLVLPVVATLDNGKTEEMKFPFGFCSAHGVYGVPGDDYQQNVKTYAEVLPTIVMPHMGAEYKTSHDQLRQNIYRRFIDLGADAVIADHPHTVQDTEAYKGKLITYSLGNFMFDQTANNEVPRSAAIEANITISADSSDLEAWNALGEKCLKDKSTCFEKIQAAKLDKPTIKYSYDYHATTSAGNRITRLADQADQTSIGQRLNWPTTLAGLDK
ncbi:CapA family protein [Candidatus Saccharibacteria bacterium]|nr:CapA family protein [Candidatus Saccharibacteria bacterium]